MMFLSHKNCRNFFAVVLLSLVTGAFAFSAEIQHPAILASPFSITLQMLFGLGIVLMLIAACAWMLKRFSSAQFGLRHDLKVVSAVAVGQRERVVLVDVGDTRLVLGVAPGQVNKLMEMPRSAVNEDVGHSEQVSFMVKLKEKLAARGEVK